MTFEPVTKPARDREPGYYWVKWKHGCSNPTVALFCKFDLSGSRPKIWWNVMNACCPVNDDELTVLSGRLPEPHVQSSQDAERAQMLIQRADTGGGRQDVKLIVDHMRSMQAQRNEHEDAVLNACRGVSVAVLNRWSSRPSTVGRLARALLEWRKTWPTRHEPPATSWPEPLKLGEYEPVDGGST